MKLPEEVRRTLSAISGHEGYVLPEGFPRDEAIVRDCAKTYWEWKDSRYYREVSFDEYLLARYSLGPK